VSAVALALLLLGRPPAPPAPVVVGSKPFGESYLLAEMFAAFLS
jgi:glycine betaine/choline ABC-type transport system substrate-binding protein